MYYSATHKAGSVTVNINARLWLSKHQCNCMRTHEEVDCAVFEKRVLDIYFKILQQLSTNCVMRESITLLVLWLVVPLSVSTLRLLLLYIPWV